MTRGRRSGRVEAVGAASNPLRVAVPLAVLLLSTALVYAPVRGHQFLEFDDQVYVTENSKVREGLTFSGVRWAFASAGYANNWHPLTWISHMVDAQLFGLDAGAHHAVNLLLHLANTALLFSVLRRATGADWPSLLAAGLFALHPLHVESVAWVAERKDVLSAFFWMCTLRAYLAYAARPSAAAWAATTAALACALLSKPMAVTLPFTLLLLDFWPLGRLPAAAGAAGASRGVPWGRLLGEKAAWFALAGAAAAATYLVQDATGATRMLGPLPLSVRAGTALGAYLGYVEKTVWPRELTWLYFHPERAPSAARLLAASAFLAAVSAAALRARRTRPWLAAGWCWYLGTLVPVIGLVQVGRQSMADRYTYVPLVGAFVAAAWGARRRAGDARAARLPAAAACLALVVAFAGMSRRQVWVWRDDLSLFTHAVSVEPGNFQAHLGLGLALHKRDRRDEAFAHYREAIRRRPDDPEAYLGLGILYAQQGLYERELAVYEEALAHVRGSPRLYTNLREVYKSLGRPGDALRAEEEARRLEREEAARPWGVRAP